jgi:hypothetical protein
LPLVRRNRNLRTLIFLVLFLTLAGFLLSPKPVTAGPVFSDNFNTNSINPAFWNVQLSGTGPSVAAANQSIVVTFAANSFSDQVTQPFQGGLSGVCTLSGDFNMQVDYKLILWPQSSGVRVGLRLTQHQGDLNGDATERVGWGIGPELGAYPREVYLTDFSDGVQGTTGTSDLNGTLRVVRTGSTVTGYYHSSGGWVPIHSGPSVTGNRDADFALTVWSGNPVFVGQTTKVGFDNFVINSGQLRCPTISLNPKRGPVGTQVEAQVSGFPASSFGPDQVIMSFDGNFLGTATNLSGNFSFTFDVPEAQPGTHLVKALDLLTQTTANASFLVTLTETMTVNVDVGTLYFPGDTAAIYTLATLSGAPLNSTTLQLQLTLMRPDGVNATLATGFVGSGLFKTTYVVQKTGPIGTYAIVAKAHAANVQDVWALATFEVKQTWLAAQGPGLMTTTVAITGIAGVIAVGVVWRRGTLSRRD